MRLWDKLNDPKLPFKTKSFRFENQKNVIVGHLNINSVRKKFRLLKYFIYNEFDIFLVSETKTDSSFPNSQYRLTGYEMFTRGRDSFGGGIWSDMENHELWVEMQVTIY